MGIGKTMELLTKSEDGLIAPSEMTIHQVEHLKGDLLEALGEADDLIDVRRLTVEILTQDGGRSLARLIRTVASRELRFVELYGALFGALIGAMEALLWSVFQTWWLLPLVGGASASSPTGWRSR